MSTVLTAARLQSLVAEWLESHSRNIETSCLLGIAHPKGDVVEAEETSSLRLRSLVRISGLQGEGFNLSTHFPSIQDSKEHLSSMN